MVTASRQRLKKHLCGIAGNYPNGDFDPEPIDVAVPPA